MIYTYSNFDDGLTIVKVKIDIQQSKPALNFIDCYVETPKEFALKLKSSFHAVGFKYPMDSISVSLSKPTPLKKEQYELSIALAILADIHGIKIKEDVLVIGNMDFEGNVDAIEINGIYEILDKAKKLGINYAIIPLDNNYLPENIKTLGAFSLDYAFDGLIALNNKDDSKFHYHKNVTF